MISSGKQSLTASCSVQYSNSSISGGGALNLARQFPAPPSVSLAEWVGHRVLARNSCSDPAQALVTTFQPGVIRAAARDTVTGLYILNMEKPR